jgi:uncharacterized protein (DUF1800 family)
MGQSLFDPPDVGGWPNNQAWISSSTALARVNFASGALDQLSAPPSFDRGLAQIDGVLGPQTAKLLNQTSDQRQRWFLLLASPEFQLK